ncbi:hypothetical protein VNI00_003098 [Paramarasmius palmivorus]|uniref:Monopolin complex subunit Csm1/Pcs1 C-terminal domain-containing protein n=1 Tax=Paramarasmius palmivorus TaxID=297713 RepID=A0AAW0DRL7_9AGAR
MSDNDSDLGGLGPVTPAAPRRATTTAATSRSKPKPKSNAAGPNVDAGEEAAEDEDEEIEVDELASNSTATNRQGSQAGGRRQTARKQAVTPAAVNNKGKQKAAPPPARSRPAATNNRRRVEEDAQTIEDSDNPQEVAAPPPTRTRAAPKQQKTTTARESELERLRWRAEQAEQRCADLMKQLEELHRTRVTEAEQLMEAQTAQYDAQLEGENPSITPIALTLPSLAKERIITQLTQSLAKVEPLSRSGRTSVLHLITRDAADEEKRMIEQEVAKLRDELADKARVINEKDDLLAEKDQIVKELQYELKLERENAQKSNHRPPGSAQRGRGGVLGTDDPKNTEVIKFYEDVTNLLVPSMKPKPGRYVNTEDWNLTCVYTYVGEEADAGNTKSLHFTLRSSHEPKPDAEEPITSTDQLHQSMYYVPLDLDKETDDFVARLKFLGSPFSFPRTQLPLFLRTIYNTVGEALNGEEGSDDDDDQMQS